ncbi:MAG: hypothetical protein IPI01_21190 [Ignavibacteriae bacterium]|nr:hypothetical protein [Ignavibacteriota bacterium]
MMSMPRSNRSMVVRIDNAWTDKLIVTDGQGKRLLASTLTEKAVILCPFHKDASTSAFIGVVCQ